MLWMRRCHFDSTDCFHLFCVSVYRGWDLLIGFRWCLPPKHHHVGDLPSGAETHRSCPNFPLNLCSVSLQIIPTFCPQVKCVYLPWGILYDRWRMILGGFYGIIYWLLINLFSIYISYTPLYLFVQVRGFLSFLSFSTLLFCFNSHHFYMLSYRFSFSFFVIY